MSDDIFIDTILEAQAIVARHIAGEHASAEETIAKLMQLLDNTELVKALAKRGYSSKRSSETGTNSESWQSQRPSRPLVPCKGTPATHDVASRALSPCGRAHNGLANRFEWVRGALVGTGRVIRLPTSSGAVLA